MPEKMKRIREEKHEMQLARQAELDRIYKYLTKIGDHEGVPEYASYVVNFDADNNDENSLEDLENIANGLDAIACYLNILSKSYKVVPR